MKKIVLFCLFLFIANFNLNADGIPFKGDEFDGHSITITLKQPWNKSSNTYILAKEQADEIFTKTGVMLKSIELCSLEFAKTTCTCEILNIGIVYPHNRVVIPIAYIGKDACNRLGYKETETSVNIYPYILSGVVVVAVVFLSLYFWRRIRRHNRN
jgi:hypothetical protein